MSARLIASVVIFICGFGRTAEAEILFSGERNLNNFVSELLEVSSISSSSQSFTFTRSSDGWTFISSACKGEGMVRLILDKESDVLIAHDAEGGPPREAMRYVTQGKHTIRVDGKGQFNVEKLVVKAIPNSSIAGWVSIRRSNRMDFTTWTFSKRMFCRMSPR
jgi:hypothetical protein